MQVIPKFTKITPKIEHIQGEIQKKLMNRYRESVRAASAKINIVSIVSREILESCGITHGSNSMLSDVINESNTFNCKFNIKNDDFL
jgi:hypothetical protein